MRLAEFPNYHKAVKPVGFVAKSTGGVIVPTHRWASVALLARPAKSALRQAFSHFKLTRVDDDSIGHSDAAIRDFGKR